MNRFIDLVLSLGRQRCRRTSLDSLTWFDTGAQERYKATFANLTPDEKLDFLNLVAWHIRTTGAGQRNLCWL